MTYFKYFPRVLYNFGNEITSDVFENIAIYSDVIDQVRDQVSFYEDYFIKPGQRPDQVSTLLYDIPDYHWTFYLMNPKLREQGWPLDNNSLFKLASKKYHLTVLNIDTVNFITNRYLIGSTIRGLSSGAEGVVKHREMDLGQIWLSLLGTDTFQDGELIFDLSTNSATALSTSSLQYNAVHHYEDVNGNYKDLGFESNGRLSDPGAQLTPVTWLERLKKENDELKKIRVIKRDIITEVVESFREAVAL